VKLPQSGNADGDASQIGSADQIQYRIGPLSVRVCLAAVLPWHFHPIHLVLASAAVKAVRWKMIAVDSGGSF